MKLQTCWMSFLAPRTAIYRLICSYEPAFLLANSSGLLGCLSRIYGSFFHRLSCQMRVTLHPQVKPNHRLAFTVFAL